MTNIYEVRQIVGRYFRVRAQFPGVGIQGYSGFSEKGQRALFEQLAADVEHSDLLVRLLQGEEPMPYEMWVAREQGVPDLTPPARPGDLDYVEHSVRVPAESSAEAAQIMTGLVTEPWIVVVESDTAPTWAANVLASNVDQAIKIAAGPNGLEALMGTLIYASPIADMYTAKIDVEITHVVSEGDKR